MERNDSSAVREQYRTSDNLDIRIRIHRQYSTNRQGFGNWIASHYRIGQGAAVLELGCGTGDIWVGREDMAAKCAKLVLSDFSEGMLAQARKNLRAQKGISYSVVDIQDIPFGDGTFDIVIANMMLYHVPDIQKGLAEVRRVLKENGTFYCATYGENGIMEYLCGLFREYGVQDRSNHRFTLQNGRKQLSGFFSSVARYDYADALKVTNPEDIADYVYSLAGMTELRRLPRETLLSVFRENAVDGALYIPKEYGLFVARQVPAGRTDLRRITALYRYVRIQGRENSYVTKYPKGVFSLCWNLIRDKALTAEEEKLFIAIDAWFKEHLPEPEPCKNHEPVITFFKCDRAGEMLKKLEPAIRLLDRHGKPYDVVYTNFVGTIVYEDDWQIAVSVQDGKMI